MSALGVYVRNWLLGLKTGAGQRIHEDHVPQLDGLEPDADFPPYIYFVHDGMQREEFLSREGKVPEIHVYTVECIAKDGSASSLMADAVSAADGAMGILPSDLGSSIVFVDDQSSDYVPRGLRLDVGSNVKALIIEVHQQKGC